MAHLPHPFRVFARLPVMRRFLASALALGAAVATAQQKGAIRIDAAPDKPAVADTTHVWTAAFPAVWNQVSTGLGGGRIAFVQPRPLADSLNAFIDTDWKPVLPPRHLLLAGEATPEFCRNAGARLREMFPGETGFPALAPVEKGYAVICALNETLVFDPHFYRAKRTTLDFRTGSGRTVPVEYFGTTSELAGQFSGTTSVLQYVAGKSCVLALKTKDPDQEVILAKGLPAKTVAEAVEAVRPLRNPAKPDTLREGDTLKVPLLSFTRTDSYGSELEGVFSVAGKHLPWRFVSAWQWVKFDLDEEGARVKVVAAAGAEPFCVPLPPPPRPKPRFFLYDQPFHVLIWRKDAAWPYFAAWIDGTGALLERVAETK